MELLSTLLSALGIYSSERNTFKANNAQEFIQWLDRHHFTKLKAAIESDNIATLAVEQLLKEDHQILVDKLGTIENLLGNLASSNDALGKLSLALNPQRTLSEQAVSILRQMIDSGCSRFLVLGANIGEPILAKMDGGGGNMEYTERQFIEDDLTVLVRLGLLNLSYNSKGNREYGATRSAKEFLKSLS
jgi:hypothetical protein